MEYLEEMASEAEDEERIESLYAELSYLAEHPFDLNRATAEELQQLPFLSGDQIHNILSYRKRYGQMQTVYELKNMEELDFQTIELLLPFVYIGKNTIGKRPFTLDNLVHYGKNELYLRYGQPLQQKKDDTGQYLGEPFYHSMRYSYTFGDRLQSGAVAEKDAGEPFWNKHHKGYDFYSFHLLLKESGWLQTLAIGDYKMSFGQGLVVSNDFTPGGNAVVTQVERRTYGFRRHFSTSEKDFFRGAAATLRRGDLYASVFYSRKKIDATPADSLTVSAIKTDGLHRLAIEREKSGLLTMQTSGGNLRYATSELCLGITALAYSFGNYTIMPNTRPYNLFYFRGSSNLNMSVDYLWKNRALKLYGETAMSANKALATLHAFQLKPASYLSLLLLFRYYDKKYQAYFSNAFSQNTSAQNEQGLYMGLQFTPFPYWNVSASADVFRFPWLRYGADAPSAGKEYRVQADYTQMKNVSLYLRYRYRQREKNQTPADGTLSVLPYEQKRLRLQLQCKMQFLLFKTSIEGIVHNDANKRSKGFMPAQSIGWRPAKIPFRASLHVAYFHTDDYDTRLSSYEENILYAFVMPQFYGQGFRLSVTFRWDAPKNLSLFARLSSTHYTGQDVAEINPEKMEGNTKADISAILRQAF
jgi:hypothetical protein